MKDATATVSDDQTRIVVEAPINLIDPPLTKRGWSKVLASFHINTQIDGRKATVDIMVRQKVRAGKGDVRDEGLRVGGRKLREIEARTQAQENPKDV